MEEDISEQVKAGNIKKIKKYKYLGITINEEENLKRRIEELKQVSGNNQRNRDYRIKESSRKGEDTSEIKTF